MRSGTSWVRRASSAVPYGVLGGTAVLAAALAWQRRRARQRRLPERQLRPQAPEGELRPQPPEAAELSAVEPAGETVRFAPTPDAPTGESYDSVSLENAEAEWLLRATESGPPHTDPQRQFSEPIILIEDEGEAEEEGVEGVRDSFFEIEEEEGKFESEREVDKSEGEGEGKSNG